MNSHLPVLLTIWQDARNAQPLDSFARVFRQLYVKFINALPGILTAAFVFLAFLVVAAVGRRIIAKVAPRVNADTGVVLLLSRVFYYGVLTFGILTALPLTGLNVNALVAGLGLTAFAIGFALKDVLSNLLSGIMLLVYRPFHIGDHIKMGEHEGTITTIRMRDTVLRAPDGRSIIIPNTKLITEVVVNNSTARLARDTVAVRLADEADLGRARKVLSETLGAESELVKRVEPQIGVTQVGGAGESQLESGFWYDPRRTSRSATHTRLVERLKRAFVAANIRADVVSLTNNPPPGNVQTTGNQPETREENVYE